MFLEPVQYALGAVSGGLVGLTLGLFGGGGSILAVPLMVYLVGVPNAHLAIGTSAVSVAANAVTGLASHARNGTVKWRCAAMYSIGGRAGCFLWIVAWQGDRWSPPPVALCSPHAGRRRADVPPPRGYRKSSRHVHPRQRAESYGIWRRYGAPVGLLRHWRRVPDRSWPCSFDGYADDQRHRLIARCRDRIRPDNGDFLRPVGDGRLAACLRVHCRGDRWRPRRLADRTAAAATR